MRTDITIEKTGLSMKKFTFIYSETFILIGFRLRTDRSLLSVGYAYFHSWRKLVVSLADYGFTGGESSLHHNLVAELRAKLDKARSAVESRLITKT